MLKIRRQWRRAIRFEDNVDEDQRFNNDNSCWNGVGVLGSGASEMRVGVSRSFRYPWNMNVRTWGALTGPQNSVLSRSFRTTNMPGIPR